MTRLLIVNADDYGLTAGISLGILRAHREGIVTSASVLAIGPAHPKESHPLPHPPPELVSRTCARARSSLTG